MKNGRIPTSEYMRMTLLCVGVSMITMSILMEKHPNFFPFDIARKVPGILLCMGVINTAMPIVAQSYFNRWWRPRVIIRIERMPGHRSRRLLQCLLPTIKYELYIEPVFADEYAEYIATNSIWQRRWIKVRIILRLLYNLALMIPGGLIKLVSGKVSGG